MLYSTIAVIATCISTLFTSFGYMLIKNSHDKARLKKVPNYYTCEFISGILTTLFAGLIHVGKSPYLTLFLASLAFADMIVLSSVTGLTIIFNTLISICFQKEVFSKHDLMCIIFTVLGASTIVVHSNLKDVKYSTQVKRCLINDLGNDRSTYLFQIASTILGIYSVPSIFCFICFQVNLNH